MTRGHHRTSSPRFRPRHRDGFSLIELAVGLIVTSVLVIATGSAIVIAARAVPDTQSAEPKVLDGGRVLNELAQELRYALGFPVRSAVVIEFIVADRDLDGKPETIRYEWSGTAGDSLTRQYNGGTVVNVAEDVHEFELVYGIDLVTESRDTEVESAEVLLASYTSAASTSSFSVTSADWVGQYFTPALPAEATRWRVTRVHFRAKEDGAVFGEISVQLRPADASRKPTAEVLEAVPMYETDLSMVYKWEQFSFDNMTWQSPSTRLCLVLEGVIGAVPARIQFENNGTGLVVTSDEGSDWLSINDAMRHYVYGTYVSPGPTQTIDHTYLTRVQIGLRLGSGPRARVDTATGILNRPEVTP